MPEPYLYPVNHPIITDCLIEGIMAQELEDGPRAKAFDTTFRYSGAGSCGMKLSLEALGHAPSNPFDAGSAWVVWLGKLIHKEMDVYLVKRFPHATVEMPSLILPTGITYAFSPDYITTDPLTGLVSGSADAFVPEQTILDRYADWCLGSVLYELKTMGGFAFDKSIGLLRKAYKQGTPEGPRESAIIQAAMNALACNADTVVVGELALEAVSKGIAEKLDFSTFGRIGAEWIIPKDVWFPIAEREIDRLGRIQRTLDEGNFAARSVPEGDVMVQLNPHAARQPWQCLYCAYNTACVSLTSNSIQEASEVLGR